MASTTEGTATVAAERIRHCSHCGETSHARTKCPPLVALRAERAAASAAESARIAEEYRRRREEAAAAAAAEEARARTEFAAQPVQQQLLALFDSIKKLQESVLELSENQKSLQDDIQYTRDYMSENYVRR